MNLGRQRGERGGRHLPSVVDVGLFADERGATSVAAAVAVLLSIVLVFGLANVQWATSTAADVQVVADAGALAGANMVAAYVTVAQVLDALVLSLGLVGMLTFAIGLVLSALPVVSVAAPPVLEAAQSVLGSRGRLATSGARGLKALEDAVPYLVAANSFLTVRANGTRDASYIGIAVPYPLEGESDFGLLDSDDAADQVRDLKERGEKIDEFTELAAEQKALADEALERGWRADCGDNPCMCERAWALAGLSGALNPTYPSSAGWNFGVPILRARAYYRCRLDNEVPLDSSVEESVRSEARKAFYRFALEEVNRSSYVEYADGSVSCDLHPLPANTSDVRNTGLYTEQVWPTTGEVVGATVHAYAGCPGAEGPFVGYSSVAEIEQGTRAECPVCRFSVVDLGRAPAASTSIPNGFEHHWSLVVEASRDFETFRNGQVGLEGQARDASEEATDLFSKALQRLTVTRVKLLPPGRYGCVCVVASPAYANAPEGLSGLFGPGAVLPPRAAVAGAALAKEEAASNNNVLAGFFDGLVSQGGLIGGASAVLDGVMTVWGDALLGYGDAYAAFTSTADSAFQGLAEIGLGGVSSWLQEGLRSVMALAAVEPADLSVRRPVLVNTVDVMERSGNDWYAAVRFLVLVVQSVDQDVSLDGLLGVAGMVLQTFTGEDKILVAEIGIPGTDLAVPLEIDLAWLAGLGRAA